MSKEKKGSIFKRIFSSKQDCCSVVIEEVEENNKKQSKTVNQKDASCCSDKTK